MSAHAVTNDALPLGVPPVGTILAGVYRVDGLLGTGGMGVILRATELASDRAVAIKVMTTAAAADPEQLTRFRREAKAVSSLTSEHVVRVLDFGELESGLPFLVMEHLEGESLAALSKARGPLPCAEAVDLVLQAIHGVSEAHALGIVHRDLKPANLFVTGAAGSPVVKVLDFGASKLTAESTVDPGDPGGVTFASSLIGSPRYMAPEQIRTALAVDARADVYALGATLHELLSGAQIFFADTLASIFAQVLWDAPASLAATRDDVPPGLLDVVSRCLAKSADDRYATVDALAVALAPFGSSRAAAPGSIAIAVAPLARAVPPKPKPAAASGSKLIAARLFKPDDTITKVRKPTAANGAVPKARKASSTTRADVVLKSSTVRMARVRMASEAPKKTVRIAAFALAARLSSSVAAVPAMEADATARAQRTVRMARFEPAAARTQRSSPPIPRALLVVMAMAVLALIALAVVVTRHRAHARSSSSSSAGPAEPARESS